MYQKIVLAGGTGFLGDVLSDYYKDKTKELVILSRKFYADKQNIHYRTWDGKTAGDWAEALEGADLLINLSGKNVNCRYTEENKKEILLSRTESTETLGLAISNLKMPPKLWINCASATIYRHAEDRYQDEDTGAIGSGFSVDVCKAWESSFRNTETPGTRKVILRVAIVLGRADGVFPRLKTLVQTGMGGQQGNGKQYVSWIHEQDLARITEWLLQNEQAGGVYNAVAPGAIQNKQLMQLMRQAYGVPVGLSTPQWLLEIGTRIIGTETELILKSRWVHPKRLLEQGFQFQFPQVEQAINELLSTRL